MKRIIVLNVIFWGWLALAAIGNAYDASTVHDRAASRIDAAIAASE